MACSLIALATVAFAPSIHRISKLGIPNPAHTLRARELQLSAPRQKQPGDYTVGSGAWSTGAAESSHAAEELHRKGGEDCVHSASPPSTSKDSRSRGRGNRGPNRTSRGSPIVNNVLRKMSRLDSSCTLEDVDAILSGKKLRDRDYTTVLATLKARRAWQVALRVGEWMKDGHEQGSRPHGLPNRAHYQVMLSTCAASGEARAAQHVADDMVSCGMPIDRVALSTLILAYERGELGDVEPCNEHCCSFHLFLLSSTTCRTFEFLLTPSFLLMA